MKEKDLTHSALIEIGTEEIPAAYLPPALDFMRNFSESYLQSKQLKFQNQSVVGTPRRLSLLISGLAPKSEELIEEVWGPSLKVAKDAAGNWTPAALGFAQSHGVPIEEVQVGIRKETEALSIFKRHPGQKSEKVVRELFSALIPEIPFPKKMVWDKSQFRFARPIRNLVTLFDDHLLRVQIGTIKSSNKTFPLQHLSSKKITLSTASNYVSNLRNQCILVDPLARQETILRTASQLALKVSGHIGSDEKLLSEVVWLVEHPVALLGSFDPKFLELPREFLITCMKKHQKFFSVFSSEENLLPYFIAIRNGLSENQDLVRKGYEKVLNARLNDARFFFEEDLKKPIEFFVSKCSGISLQGGLGSLSDKIERMKTLARFSISSLERENHFGLFNPDLVERAIHLSKFDLTTHMVYEFPELQGIVGEIYANRHGEDKRVASSLREHYYPLTVQGELPTQPLSALVALTDRIDSLVGNFMIGHLPSGHSDPYALRRSSTGILRILLQQDWPLSLRELTKLAYQQIFAIRSSPEKNGGLIDQILNFFAERFQLLMEDEGFKSDEVIAVIKNPIQLDSFHLRITLLRQKIVALHEIRSHPDFASVTVSFKRLSNILKQARAKNIVFAPQMFNILLLKEKEEIDLNSVTNQLLKKTSTLIQQKKYLETLREWIIIRETLNQFFEKVLVMDQDPAICVNRLSLLSLLESLFKEIADFSWMQNPSN